MRAGGSRESEIATSCSMPETKRHFHQQDLLVFWSLVPNDPRLFFSVLVSLNRRPGGKGLMDQEQRPKDPGRARHGSRNGCSDQDARLSPNRFASFMTPGTAAA